MMGRFHKMTKETSTNRKGIISERMLGVTSLIIMGLCVPLLWVGIWQAKRHHQDCLKFLEFPILLVSTSLLIATLLGLVGAMYRYGVLVWAYMLLVLLLLVLLLAFTLFAWFVTRGGGGHIVLGASYEEYRLGDFTLWFQQQVSLSLSLYFSFSICYYIKYIVTIKVWDMIAWC